MADGAGSGAADASGDGGVAPLDFHTMETSLVLACAVFALTALAAVGAKALPCTSPRVRQGLTAAALAMTWYSMSVGFTLFNKFVLRCVTPRDRTPVPHATRLTSRRPSSAGTHLRYWHGSGFPYPLSITMVHMCVKWALTATVVYARSCCGGRAMPHMPRRAWLTMAVPIGAATSLDIVLSNFALLFTTVSLTTVRSTHTVRGPQLILFVG